MATRKDQTRHHLKTTIAASNESRLNLKPDEPNPPLTQATHCLKAFDDGQTPVLALPIFRSVSALMCYNCHARLRAGPTNSVAGFDRVPFRQCSDPGAGRTEARRRPSRLRKRVGVGLRRGRATGDEPDRDPGGPAVRDVGISCPAEPPPVFCCGYSHASICRSLGDQGKRFDLLRRQRQDYFILSKSELGGRNSYVSIALAQNAAKTSSQLSHFARSVTH